MKTVGGISFDRGRVTFYRKDVMTGARDVVAELPVDDATKKKIQVILAELIGRDAGYVPMGANSPRKEPTVQ